MRCLFFVDEKVPEDELNQVLDEVKELYKRNTDIDLDIVVRFWPLPALPFETYYDTYRGVSQKYLGNIAQLVEAEYGKRFDQITLVVADENWAPSRDKTPVWGWNISAGIRGYEVQQCRFDTVRADRAGRIANSVGTIYHEMMHSHDGFCYRVFGATLEFLPALDVLPGMYDAQIVHGEGKKWEYIRWKENQEALRVIGPVLKAACEVRKQQFNNGTTLAQKVAEGYRGMILKATEPYAKW